ncbi:hypothetical protein [Gimesia aquarii]|uniref:hypothetical protein n=1 Tax=Gimesia aquarii TaxID=2527964 RepID=UPI0011AA6634|nr:hypothetical protein [Gimesia aquarii]
MDKDPERVLYYRFVCEPAFCGYAGYSKISLKSENQKLADNIQKAYYQIRKSVPLELRVDEISPNSALKKTKEKLTKFEEINGLSLFLYNEDYEWQKRKIAIKYNEDWIKDLQKFGFKGGRYCEFVKTSDAIVRSWALGNYIKPLAVQLPEVAIEKYKTVNVPMTPKGPLKALILFDRDYKQYFNMKRGMQLLEVSNKEIKHYYVDKREWKLDEEE